MSWSVPERGRGEGALRYRDKLNHRIDDFRRYAEDDRFPDWQRAKFRRRIGLLEKAVRGSWRPGAGSR